MRRIGTGAVCLLLVVQGLATGQTPGPSPLPTLQRSPRMQQLQRHPAMAPKGALRAPWTKVAHRLREAVAASAALENTAQTSRANAVAGVLRSLALPTGPDGRTRVTVYVSSLTAEQRTALEHRGLQVTFASAEHGFVEGWIALSDLEGMATLEFVTSVQPVVPPVTNSGSVTSEGDALLRADQARQAFGVSGEGIKVGVMSDSVDGIGTAQGSGDLPDDVQVLQLGPGGSEGTAMLEIVHDLAPGSPLAFYGPSSSGDMITGIDQLAAAGAKVIVDDLTFFDQPHFEEGPVAQTVNAVVAQGVVYVTSSGNYAAGGGGRAHYEANYTDGGSLGAGLDHVHAFAPGTRSQEIVVLPGGNPVVLLQWANPFGQASDDYDLYLADTGGTIIAASEGEQNGDDVPFEVVTVDTTGLVNPITLLVAVNRFAGAARRLELYYTGGVLAIDPATAAGSIPGHANASGAITVGTINADDPGTDTIAPYSSQGPCDLFFPASETRAKPDITGIDAVAVTGAAGFPSPFFGTSAAAPHVAAIAALLLDAKPSLSPAQVKQALQSTAVDLGVSGVDFVFGAGRADAREAVASVATGGTTTTSTLPTGAICGNGAPEAGEGCDDGNTANGDCCSATCQPDGDDTPCTDDADACTDDVCATGTGCAHFLQIAAADVDCELGRIGFDGSCVAQFDAKTARAVRKLANQAGQQLLKAEAAATETKRAKKLLKTAKKLQALTQKLSGDRAVSRVDPDCLDYLRALVGVLLEIVGELG